VPKKSATRRRLLVEANALTAILSAGATELESRREHAGFLMRELAHRGNNQLAVVKGMAVQNGGLWVQSPELELRDLPGDTPNRLRKARAKELSES
jgi:two-component sensor histidine kinase